MKDHLQSQIQNIREPNQARNYAREYLQAQILSSLQRIGAMIPLAFHGGTALRFLYAARRYSEDLDFALEGEGEAYLHNILNWIEAGPQRWEAVLVMASTV